ncbi:hypothetical protein FOBRF1_013750 [Fusarium oxysporum]
MLWTRETGVVENSKHSSVTLTASCYNDQASLLSPESSFADSLSVFSSEASSWQETIPDEGASSTWDTSWELDLASLTSGSNASSHSFTESVVFNSSLFRNARSEHMHTIPTWDHKDPAAFRGATHKEILERYNTISFKDCEVAKVEKTSAGDFAATAVDGTTFTGRRVLLASGVTDLPLDIQGYDDYHCLFCHGYDDVGKPSAGILALGEISSPAAATALARSAKQITSKVVIYTSNNPGVQTAIAALLGQNNTAITTDDREIASLALGSEGSGIVITFADGSSVQEAFLAHKPPTKLNGPFAEQLGVELTPGGDIQVTPPFGATSVKGVYAAGDCAAKMKNAMQAMHMGAFAGVGMAHDLQAEGPKI